MSSQLSQTSGIAGLRVARVVTLASATGKYGGPYDTAKRQARIVASLGADVDLVAAHLPGDRPDEGRSKGLHFALTPARQQLPFGQFLSLVSLRTIRALWKRVGTSDLVHISFAREAIPIIAATVCIIRRKAWIAQTHGMMTSRRSKMHSLIDRMVVPILRQARAIIALTENEKHELKQLGSLEKQTFFTLGNPLPETLPCASSTRRSRDAVFIARLHPRKRVVDFIEAANRANQNSWAERYTIVGPDGGELAEVQASQNSLPNLDYHGAVSSHEVADILLSSAVFVLCSRNEPWGNVLTSALALGVPVVVTQSCALAADVAHAGAGIVVSDGEPAEIASAIHRIVSNPDIASAMSTRGRAHALEHYSDESQMAALCNIYRGALKID